jgi:hypothetical protein
VTMIIVARPIYATKTLISVPIRQKCAMIATNARVMLVM